MPDGVTVEFKVHFGRGPAGRREARFGDAPAQLAVLAGSVPRVARLMALAIRFDQLLRDGGVANQTELARLARVTQPRMTQIMNLLHLAPDIQEAVLLLPPTLDGRDAINERALRPIASLSSWREQRVAWRNFCLECGITSKRASGPPR